MPKTTDYCYQCGNDHEIQSDNYKLCKSCLKWQNVILYSMCFGVLMLIALLIWKCNFKNTIHLVGLILNIIGTYFLATGYLSVLISSAGGWGGVDQEDIKKYGYKTAKNIHFGLIFLILGFFIHGLSLFVFG